MPETPGFAELAGRVVLVTGASTGIGAAVAAGFARCGARVAIHYNRSRDGAEAVAEALRAEGHECWLEQAELSDTGAAGTLIARVADRAGGLDVLVNNAGTVVRREPMAEFSDELYRGVIDLNLTSVFESCRAVLPIFRARKRGTIINTSSVSARIGGGPGAIVYAAAKAAVSNFSRGLARELAPEGFRVNVVAPGFIMTPLHARLTSPEITAAYRANIPLGRLGEPDDCVGAYLFLACERLAGYVTGQVVEVNGGLSMP